MCLDHNYETPITSIHFHDISRNMITTDQRAIKIWNRENVPTSLFFFLFLSLLYYFCLSFSLFLSLSRGYKFIYVLCGRDNLLQPLRHRPQSPTHAYSRGRVLSVSQANRYLSFLIRALFCLMGWCSRDCKCILFRHWDRHLAGALS